MEVVSRYMPILIPLTAICYLITFFIYADSIFEPSTPEGTSSIGDVVGDLFQFVTFNIPDIPIWFSLLIFIFIQLPWLLLISSFVFQIIVGLGGNTVTGTLIAVTAGILLLVALF